MEGPGRGRRVEGGKPRPGSRASSGRKESGAKGIPMIEDGMDDFGLIGLALLCCVAGIGAAMLFW